MFCSCQDNIFVVMLSQVSVARRKLPKEEETQNEDAGSTADVDEMRPKDEIE